MIRLKDVARAAGVSIMTVSKALRDKPDISVETRERVRLLAQQLGYVPDAAARGLRSRHTRLLGLVIPATTDPVFARVMLAIEERAFELGYDVVLAHSQGKVEREETVLRRLLARRVDGLLVSPVYRLDQRAGVYDEIRRRGVPCVVLGHRGPFCGGFPNVETDDLNASVQMTRHLLELGHRRIAYFAGPLVSPWAQERLEGYRRAHRESGLSIDDRLIFRAGGTIEEGAAAALQWIEERTGATAIQAANDLVAIGAADTLLNQGLRVPADVSIGGHGNLLAAEYFRVPLTTVRQPKLRLGIAAMELMQQLLRGEAADSRRLPSSLAVRQSTGGVPAVGVGVRPGRVGGAAEGFDVSGEAFRG